MCDACQWPEAVRRMRAAQDVALDDGDAVREHALLVLAIHEVQALQHVSRERMIQLWKIEKSLGMVTDRPECMEDEMPRKKDKPLKGMKSSIDGTACKGCMHDGDPKEVPPCCDCTTENPLYDPRGPVHVPDHDPYTGECPMTDRDKAVPAIVSLVQRVVDENVPRILAAWESTHEPSGMSVTCSLSEDPEVLRGVHVDVRVKLSLGGKGSSGTVSLDAQQTRLPGT